MKRVISKDLITWYKIRDLILGFNYHNPNILKALELTKTCEHPDAIWLNNVCKDKKVYDTHSFCTILKPLENDKNALYFLYLLEYNTLDILIKSAELGCVHAKWALYFHLNDDLTVDEIKKYEERAAYHVLARYENREENLKHSALLGHIGSMINLANYYTVEFDYWKWSCLAAKNNYNVHLLSSLNGYLQPLESKGMYLVGKTLHELEIQKFKIFNDFYLSQNDKCRKAVDMWTLVATRLRIYKDLRIFIGKMIWENRNEALY